MTESARTLSTTVAAVLALAGLIYFAALLVRTGVSPRADARVSPGRPLMIGVLISASFLGKAAAGLSREPVLASTAEAFSFAFGLGALALLTRRIAAPPGSTAGEPAVGADAPRRST